MGGVINGGSERQPFLRRSFMFYVYYHLPFMFSSAVFVYNSSISLNSNITLILMLLLT